MNIPIIEQKILEFWEKKKIFEKSLNKNKGKKNFIFFEGPPTANASPGLHHVLARAFKDIIPRYKTMQGFYIERKAGWDTHGLPVELQVEKELGLKNKKDIEKYGIAEFNKKCKETVWRYKEEWEKLTKRIAFWLDLKHPYITYEKDYIESLWWIIKQIWDKGFLYQDYKVTPYCPRCGTTLSSHEISLGYKTIKENSIYVKFPINKIKNTYFLVWTTTPWTLPANIVLAINQEINYVKVKHGKDFLILAEKRLGVLSGKYKIINKKTGKNIDQLVGLKYPIKYKQLLPYLKPYPPKSFNVVFGDFVSDKEGTGIVHIAPAYGEDDMTLAKKLGLETFFMCIDKEGKFEAGFPWSGKFVKEADKEIVQELKDRKLFYNEELYEHEYPFCWRCNTPLIYYAKNSWFIKMSDLRQQLLRNNKQVNWIPDYFKYGRFGDWLKEAKDWAFSRERYWGTPLPIWKCEKCENLKVIGSIEEIKNNSKKSDNLAERDCNRAERGNKYFIMRHAEAENNLLKIASSNHKNKHHITKKGEKEAVNSLKKLKGIDLIFSSDFVRAKETAQIAAKRFKIKKIFYDKRLREINTGIFNNKNEKEYHAYFSSLEEKFYKTPPKGENLTELKNRISKFLYEIDKKYSHKNILIISHEYSIWMMFAGANGVDTKKAIKMKGKKDFLKTGEIKNLKFIPLPHNDNFELDLHRPYIDEIKFPCFCGGKMIRVFDVIDAWFDSGSMPFAQWHYPFENKEKIEKGHTFPANFISEAVDQTRGWFYTLLAISTLLNKGPAYKNVICLGHILDDKGQKMSKSKGNIIAPEEIINKYGADPLRWYLYTINEEGEGKRFNSKELEDKNKKFFGTILNSLVFFTTYTDKSFKPAQAFKSQNLLDKWIILKLNFLTAEVIKNLDKYFVVNAARLFEDFVDDLSNWYIRRSRQRFQNPKNETEKKAATQTLHYILINLTKLLAPFIPFTSEEIYQRLTTNYQPLNTNKKESVHLEDYPHPNKKLINKNLLDSMAEIRRIASLTLEARAKAGIKVRQPLASLIIKRQAINNKYNKELINILKDEINVKEIVFNEKIKNEVELDSKITPELKAEGQLRELTRIIQNLRKETGYLPKDKIYLWLEAPKEIELAINNRLNDFKEKVGAKNAEFKRAEKFKTELETKIDNQKIWIGIKKV